MFLDLSFGPAGGRHSNRSGCARQHSVADRAHRYAPGCSARAQQLGWRQQQQSIAHRCGADRQPGPTKKATPCASGERARCPPACASGRYHDDGWRLLPGLLACVSWLLLTVVCTHRSRTGPRPRYLWPRSWTGADQTCGGERAPPMSAKPASAAGGGATRTVSAHVA